MKFEYDKTYIPKEKCSLATFREKVEEQRANGKPDCVEVLFFDNELVLLVRDTVTGDEYAINAISNIE